MIRRTILEWQTICYGEGADEIPSHAADRIAALASKSPLSGSEGAVIEHGRKGLRAKGIVGVIACNDCVLEILPKIDFPGTDSKELKGHIRRRLIHMLSVALDLKIASGQLTSLETQHETLLEILIRLFSEKLVEAVRQGMPRRYVEETSDLSTLRGRLDMIRQFTALAVVPSRLACRFDALTPDTAINQIMKAAVVRLLGVARSADNQRRLRELLFTYTDITDVPVPALRWESVFIDRTNARWRELLNLARLLLGERFQTTSAGGSDGFSLLFEMNVLFEEYVAKTMTKSLAGTDLRVVSQGGRLYCLETEDRKGLFQTRPDILIKRGDQVVQIVDTKWKRLASSLNDPKQGVSQGDVYQMMAYGQLYKCNRLTLLYPHHAELLCDEGVLTAYQVTGYFNQIETATIDLSTAKTLRERLRALLLHKNEIPTSVDGRDAVDVR